MSYSSIWLGVASVLPKVLFLGEYRSFHEDSMAGLTLFGIGAMI